MVPYNPYLTVKYNAHINVEVCTSITAVKYLYKYVYKGPDRALATVRQAAAGDAQPREDEITTYVDGRYVSASEAAWRLLQFDMHSRKPPVQCLAVHLPGDNIVTFRASSLQNPAAMRETLQHNARTTLLAWFDYNKTEKNDWLLTCVDLPLTPQPDSLTTLYQDMPIHHVYDNVTRKWHKRQRYEAYPTIGRIYFVHPREGERDYMRLLLTHVPGATSFKDLRTTSMQPAAAGVGQPLHIVHPTFKAACVARGLTVDDRESELCMQEAATVRFASFLATRSEPCDTPPFTQFNSPANLRELFAALLTFTEVLRPLDMWLQFQADMAHDFLHQARQVRPVSGVPPCIYHSCHLNALLFRSTPIVYWTRLSCILLCVTYNLTLLP